MMDFFKANEKVIMVVMLAILAPSFAFTGLMMSGLQQSGQDGDLIRMYGETYKSSEVERMRGHVSRVRRVMLFMGQGMVYYRVGASLTDTIEHHIYLREAGERGLAVSSEELAETVRRVGKNLIAYYSVRKDGLDPGDDSSAFFTALNERQNSVRFTLSEYRNALRSSEVGMNMSVQEFESLIAENLLRLKLLGVADESVVISDREVYDEYEETAHKRKFQFVRVSPDDFLATAKESITDEDIKERWDRTGGEEFRNPERLQLEIAQLPANTYQPSEAEIEAFYEENKETLYKKPAPAGDDPGDAGDDPGDEEKFRPLSEVEGQVRIQVRRKREQEIVDEALAEAKKRSEMLQDFDLIDLFTADDAPMIEISQTSMFSRDEVRDLPTSFRNDAVLRNLFFPDKFAELSPGTLGETTVLPSSGGRYLYRISGKQASELPANPEAVNDQIREEVASEKAAALAEEYLNGWNDRLNEDGVTFETLAAEKNYKVHESEPLAQNEAGRFQVEGRPVLGAIRVLQSGFDIDEVGRVGNAVTYKNPATEESQVFLLRLASIEPADPTGFEPRRPSLENLVRRRKLEAARSQFQLKMYDRANVERLYEIEGEDPAVEPAS